MRVNCILIYIIMFIGSVSAQEVKSTSYSIMLKGMLSHSVNEVSVENISTDEKILFVDSRELQEYKVSRIKGALWVGYDSLDLSPLESIDKDQKVIVYCSVGYRSEKVAEKIQKMGFKDVSNLYGGIFEWKNQGKEVVDANNKPTERVHAFSKIWGIWLRKGKKVY